MRAASPIENTPVQKIEDKLRDDKRCLSIQELELLMFGIDIDAATRDDIILRYMIRMQALKNRGVEWLEKIIELATLKNRSVRLFTDMLERVKQQEQNAIDLRKSRKKRRRR